MAPVSHDWKAGFHVLLLENREDKMGNCVYHYLRDY